MCALQGIICTVRTQADDPSISANYLEQSVARLPFRWVQLWETWEVTRPCKTFCINIIKWTKRLWEASTVAGSRVADVDAVQPHVEVVLHVAPLLIIVEHQPPVTPKVKPVFFPPTKYSALKKGNSAVTICPLIDATVKHQSCLWAYVLTLSMEPTTLDHGHVRSNPWDRCGNNWDQYGPWPTCWCHSYLTWTIVNTVQILQNIL